MNYKSTVTMQAYQGLASSIILFLFPAFFLNYLSTTGSIDMLAVNVLRLAAVFIAILCLTLIAVKEIADPRIQKNVLATNMSLDFFASVFLAFTTYSGNLSLVGGNVLAVLMFVNSISYFPAMLNLVKQRGP